MCIILCECISPRKVLEMNSDTWFPERLVSDSWVSSRFSILLNCRQHTNTHTHTHTHTHTQKHPWVKTNTREHKNYLHTDSFSPTVKIYPEWLHQQQHPRVLVRVSRHTRCRSLWLDAEKCMADFTSSSMHSATRCVVRMWITYQIKKPQKMFQREAHSS